MFTFIAAVAPAHFLAVGTAASRSPAGITVPAGPISCVLRITQLKQSAAMTVPGASTGREYEQGVTGRRPVGVIVTGLTARL